MKDRVFKIVSQVFETAIEDINEDSSPDNIDSWDSLKHMNLVLALEQEFDIQFKDEQIVEMLSTGLIIETVKEVLET